MVDKTLSKKLLAIAIIVFLFGAPLRTFAGGGMTGGATEVTQLLNNVQLAIQSVSQELQYATQLEQYYTELLQQMPAELTGALDTVRQANSVIQKASQVYSSGQRLYGSLEQMKGLAERRFREFGASGLTWEDYINRSARMSDHFRQTGNVMTDHEIHVMKSVQDNYEQMREYSSQIPRTEGSHQAMMVMNGQMAMLNGTINEMLSFNAAQSRRLTERQMIEDSAKASDETRALKQNVIMGAGAAADRAFLDSQERQRK
ncbi:hypothetical protein TMEC54S_00123 [Thauera mechernichensis]